MITTLARRAVILSGCACLLGVASCGDGTAPSAPTGVPTVTVSLQSSLIAPGQGTTADIAAQAPPGDTLGAVYIFWTGLLTGGDTVLTTRRVSMATQRFFTLPASARNGTVTLTVRCITYAGKTTSTQAVLTVRDSIAPTMTWSVTPSGRMQPGDVLTVMLDAHDNALLNFTSIRITGVFSASDSVHYDFTPGRHTLTMTVPANAMLGGGTTIALSAGDYAGNRRDTVIAGPSMADLALPSVSGTVSGGRTGNVFAPGDTIALRIDATDNYRLARVGFRLGAPASVNDSVFIAGMAYTRLVSLVVPPAWSGTGVLTVFAMDSAGNRREVTMPLTVTSRTRRTIISSPLTTAVRDVAFDVRRGLAYLSLPARNSVQALDLSTGALTTAYILPSAPGGIDVTLGGDSILVAMVNTPFIRAIRLPGGAQDSLRVVAVGSASWADGVRVMADNRALVTEGAGGSGAGSDVIAVDLGRLTTTPIQSVTESTPFAASGDRRKAIGVVEDVCCPMTVSLYDVATHVFTNLPTSFGLRYRAKPSMSQSGAAILLDSSVYTGAMTFVTTMAPPGAQLPAVMAPDGASVYWAVATGFARIRISDGVVLEVFDLGAAVTRIFVSADALTVVATTATAVHIVDVY